MPKAGTSWLFEQLNRHPDFWLPPVKELHYLEYSVPKLENAKRLAKRVASRPGEPIGRFSGRRAWEERDSLFLSRLVELADRPLDLRSYGAVFALKGSSISGDITPGYCALRPKVIQQVGTAFPELKVVLLVRDPVDRLWSHLNMLVRMGQLTVRDIESPYLLDEALNVRRLWRHAFASDVYASWKENAPGIDIRHFFFDDILGEGEKLLRKIVRFLGGTGKISVHTETNRKHAKAKRELQKRQRRVLVEAMKDELRKCAEIFGGHAVSWVKRYRV